MPRLSPGWFSHEVTLKPRAGAVTVIEMNAESAAPMEPKEVYLNRPFVYMLVDCQNYVPFFIGTLMDPGK